jgi:hypothetical protein
MGAFPLPRAGEVASRSDDGEGQQVMAVAHKNGGMFPSVLQASMQ